MKSHKSNSSVGSQCSVMMAFLWAGALFLSLVAATSVNAGTVSSQFVHFFINNSDSNCLATNLCFPFPGSYPWQTWSWTVGPTLWRWCGQRAEPKPTCRCFVLATVIPLASQPGKLFSVWASTIVTSGEWWVDWFWTGCLSKPCSLQFCNMYSLIGHRRSFDLHQWSDLRFFSWFSLNPLHSASCLYLWQVCVYSLQQWM